MGEIPWILLYFTKGSPICSLLVSILNPTEHTSVVLIHFIFTLPLPDQLSEKFYLCFLSLFFFFFSHFFFPLSQHGLHSLLLLVCFPHPFKIICNYCRHLISLFIFLQYSYSCFTLLNFVQLFLLSTLLWVFCNFVPIGQYVFNFTSNLIVQFFLFLPHYFHHPFMFYLHCKFCSLPFFSLVLSQLYSILFLLTMQHSPLF